MSIGCVAIAGGPQDVVSSSGALWEHQTAETARGRKWCIRYRVTGLRNSVLAISNADWGILSVAVRSSFRSVSTSGTVEIEASLVSGAKPRTPKGSSRTAQGASPGFKGQIAESPERAAQGVRSQLQINARHKAPLWYRDQLHRPFGASLVTVLVPRACALGFPESPLRG